MESTTFGKHFKAGKVNPGQEEAALRARVHEDSGQPTGEMRIPFANREGNESNK